MRPNPRSTPRIAIPALLGPGLASLGLLALAALGGCSGGSSGKPGNRGSFLLNQISTGQGQVYPYRIRTLDPITGLPSSNIANIESFETLRNNVGANNPVLPVATLPTEAVLPNGAAGNHFLSFRFSNELDLTSVLSSDISSSSTNSGLTTAVRIVAYDPQTEATTVVRGRGFVNGYTYVNSGGRLELVQALEVEGEDVTVLDPVAEGFPRGFSGAVDLVQPNSFVFVADTDDDLGTIETFDPEGRNLVLRIEVSNAVRNSESQILEREARTATSVGADPNPANVIGFTGNRALEISPGNGQTGVDPLGDLFVFFNKPVQPLDVGSFFSETNLTPAAGGIALNVTIAASTFSVLYYADPLSVGDFTAYRIRPAYSLPGETEITVQVQRASINAIKDLLPLGVDVETKFRTGTGPGIVNAPVSPDAIYVGIGGAEPGISIIDMNGFGQGTNGLEPDPETGEPTLSPTETYFAQENPNIGQPGINPPLGPGTSTLDAGSNGPLTLVEDTRGNTKLVGAPQISQIGDIHIGCPLDLVFNNLNINVNVSGANQVNPATQVPQPGNCIAVSTHPNPPRLVFPPPNPSRAIFAEEPTNGGANLLNPGTKPDFRQRAFAGFFGPAPPPPSPPPPPAFLPFSSRQQIGHFLYVLDRDNKQILVLNSNRMTVLDTIRTTDPYRIAFSPTLALMAVSNFSSSTVTIIDTDPRSPTFHQIVSETRVDEGPTEIVWQPDGEAICVLSSLQNSLTVIRGTDFQVDRIATGNITNPIGLTVTERYFANGNTSNVFYAYILNADGSVAVYESGPDGPNGIGFNNIVGTVQPIFPRPTAIKNDWTAGQGGFYVSHLDEFGVAVVSRCELTVSPQGQQPIDQNVGNGFLLPPTFRQKEWSVTARFGGGDPSQPIGLTFSGNQIVDFAFDDMLNSGAQPNQLTNFNRGVASSILGHSAKGALLGGAPPIQPAFMLVAFQDTGKIDVVDLAARVKITTLDVPGVQFLASYWRQ